MDTKFKRLKVIVVRHHDVDSKNTQLHQQQDTFHKLSVKIANKLGSSWAFYIATAVILFWALSGPLFKFSNTWQLVINTSTTIVTFLMVFVIQNTQNRDGKAMQLKLDELISTTTGARSEFVDVEELTDSELDELQIEFKTVHDKLMQKQNKAAEKKAEKTS